MAEIPVEKKGGIPWWVWLLLALLLLGLLFWLFADNDEAERVPVAGTEPVAVETDVGTVATVAPGAGAAAGAAVAGAGGEVPGGPITDLATIASATGDSLVGREVRLTNVLAPAVPEDAGFWVGEGNQRVWVVLEEVRAPNTPFEGRVNVDPGDRVDIVGTVQNDPAARRGAAIPGPTAPLPDGVTHYIYATRVTQSN